MSDTINKVYDLLEKVYIELQETRQEVKDVKNEVNEVKNEVKDNTKRLTKIEISIENEIKPNIKMLFEGQSNVIEKLEEHDRRFDTLEEKLAKHDVDIHVIKDNKRKAK